MDNILNIIFIIIAIKSMTIGSSFSFFLWIKYGKKYYSWYNKTILSAKFEPDAEAYE